MSTTPTLAEVPQSDRTILVAHPSRERYGSDRQCLQSVAAMVEAGWTVVVTLPPSTSSDPRADARPGDLAADLRGAGAAVLEVEAPVLRRSLLNVRGLASLGGRSVAALPRLVAAVRRHRPDVVYVSTLTSPLWVLAARLAGVSVVVHVHEAEEGSPALLRAALAAPLLLATTVLVPSEAARHALLSSLRGLERRITVLPNGVPGPPAAPPGTTATPEVTSAPGNPLHLVVVGRLTPRKGTHVALSALALLRTQGIDADLTLVGSVFPGYEWYERSLHEQAEAEGTSDRVVFAGLAGSPWPALAAADVALVPSFTESFGNAAVEAMLAARPLVASDVQGLTEVVRAGVDGLLVPPGDAAALALAVASIHADRAGALARARGAAEASRDRFSVPAYRRGVVLALEGSAAQRQPALSLAPPR